MTTPQPYAGSSASRLTSLINLKNSLSLQYGIDFTLGVPQPYTDSQGRNTKVVLTPSNSQYSAAEMHYWRLPLTAVNDLPDGFIVPVEIAAVPFSLHDILDDINTALGLTLSVNEVVDQTFTVEQASYPLRINELASYAWLDSDFSFSAHFPSTGGPGGDPFIAIRPGWFAQLAGNESGYYPLTLNETTWAAPLGETAGAIPDSPSLWKPLTGTLTMAGAGGAFFDCAVIDPSTGLPAALQPSWSVNSDAASVAPAGTYSSFGYQTIYSDDEATLVVLAPAAGATPPPLNLVGTYDDNTTITATMALVSTAT